MTTEPFVLFRLEPQPRRFEAPVRIGQLYQDAFGLFQKSSARRSAVLALTEVDIDLLSPPDAEGAVGLAARVALQSCVDRDLLSLNIFSPVAGRYLRLPKSALISPFKFETGFLGAQGHLSDQLVRATAHHVPLSSWLEGTLFLHETDPALDPIAAEELPVFTTQAGAAAALRDIRLQMAKGQVTGAADGDELVDATIQGLVSERGGRLPLNEGADLVRKIHPTRRRDELRERIRAQTRPTRPGPTGPRK